MNKVSYVALEFLQGEIQYAPAMESFKLLTNILDAAIRVFHNIKTSILSAFKTFKRSELKAYHESRFIGIKKLYTVRPVSLLSTKVPIPHQMIVTYPEALRIIRANLDKLQILSVINTVYQYTSSLENILKDREYNVLTRHLNQLIPKINHISRSDLDTIIHSIFSDKQKEKERTVRDVFGSYQDIQEVDNALLSYELLFQQVPEICHRIAEIESAINKAVNTLSNEKNPDRTYLKALHAFVYAAAIQFDSFGVFLHTLQMLEHNVTICLNKLVTENLEL